MPTNQKLILSPTSQPVLSLARPAFYQPAQTLAPFKCPPFTPPPPETQLRLSQGGILFHCCRSNKPCFLYEYVFWWSFAKATVDSSEIEKQEKSPGQCGSVGWRSSCKVKHSWLYSRSGHTPKLQVQSPVGVCTRGNQWMFLSHIDGSLPLFLLPFLSL